MMAPQNIYVSYSPGTCDYDCVKGFHVYNEVKNIDLTSSWISQVGSTSNDKSFSKKKRHRHRRKETM